ncbi:hypothetical protein A2U01_0093541, partial [Trifolium medium]|nr:hypothetical protein [Trifolium medium]
GGSAQRAGVLIQD